MALEFAGTDQYIATPAIALDDFTIVIWHIVDNLDSQRTLISNNIALAPYLALRYNNATDMLLSVRDMEADLIDTIFAHGVSTGDLVCYMFVVSGTTGKVYINLTEKGSDTNAAFGSCTFITVFNIGRDNRNQNYFDGTIFDVRIYTRALSEAERAIIYYARGSDNIVNGLMGRLLMNEKPDGQAAAGASSVIDISGQGNHGTPVNSPIYRGAPVRLINPFQATRTAHRQTKILTESITLGDTLVKAPAKILTESLTLADTLQKKPAKTFIESLTLADTLIKTPTKIFIESISLADTYLRRWRIYRTFTETMNLADSLIKKPIKTFIESLHLADTLQKKPAKTFIESISLADTYLRRWRIYRTFTETLSLTDRLSKKAGKTFLETLHLQDRYTRVVTWYRTFTEKITLSETVIKIKSNLFLLWKKLQNLFDIEGH